MRFLHDTNTFLQKAEIHAIQNKSNVSRSKAFFSHLEMSNDFLSIFARGTCLDKNRIIFKSVPWIFHQFLTPPHVWKMLVFD